MPLPDFGDRIPTWRGVTTALSDLPTAGQLWPASSTRELSCAAAASSSSIAIQLWQSSSRQCLSTAGCSAAASTGQLLAVQLWSPGEVHALHRASCAAFTCGQPTAMQLWPLNSRQEHGSSAAASTTIARQPQSSTDVPKGSDPLGPQQ